MGDSVVPSLVERAELFKGLAADALASVIGSASRLPLRQGAQLLKQGDPPDHLFLVERGNVKMSVVTPEGTQLALRFMRGGDVIGCAAVFRGIAYPATATAVEDTTVLCWSAAQINDLVQRFPKLAANALAIVGGRAEEFLQRLREAVTEKVEQRIARALLRLAAAMQQPGRNSASARETVIAVSRQDLAEFVGATHYTVSRTISAWSRQGIVTSGRGRITIRNRQQLALIAGTAPTPDSGHCEPSSSLFAQAQRRLRVPARASRFERRAAACDDALGAPVYKKASITKSLRAPSHVLASLRTHQTCQRFPRAVSSRASSVSKKGR